ncbi:MAG TPA: hypothetical protein VFR86_27525 [Burkholderiaceae bacterium]|nr:hypothetical protein [Burkholderiaceae bacterium]
MTPFWRRMPRFFVFPAYTAPLLRIAVLALIVALAGWNFGRGLFTAPLSGGLLLAAAYFATAVVLARYGFLIIERTAAGYLHPSQYPEFAERGSPYRPYKMFLIMVVVPIAITFVSAFFASPLLMVVLFIAFALLVPASTIVMTMTDSFFEAINPARCVEVARKIGKPYFALCLFLLLLMLSSQQTSEWLLPKVLGGPDGEQFKAMAQEMTPEEIVNKIGRVAAVAFFILTFVANYFFVLMCVLIGYVMYQYSDQLGVAVVGPGESRTSGRVSSAEHARRARDALVGQMVAAGEIAEAIEMINADLRDRPNDLSLHARLHKLLVIDGSVPRIEDHTERYLELLIKSGNVREALPLVEAAFARRAEYEPRALEHVVPLARSAVADGKLTLAAQLIRGFDRKHKTHPDVPAVYLIGAQLIIQGGGNTEQAQKILEHLVKFHAYSPVATEAQRYLARMAQFTRVPTLKV